MYAAHGGHVAAVNELLRKPANCQLGIKSRDGRTALSLAASKQHTEVCQRLRDAAGTAAALCSRAHGGQKKFWGWL